MTVKVLIVYATVWGNTKKMAEAVKAGADSVPDTETLLKECQEATIEDVQSSDALILGSPVHMGSPDWKIKKFIDEICSTLWMKDSMIGKVGAVFASGGGFGSAGGGAEITMLAMMNNLVELGLLIVPLPKNTEGYPFGGLQWGPYGRTMGIHMEKSGIDENHLDASKNHGKHVARLAKTVKGVKIFGN